MTPLPSVASLIGKLEMHGVTQPSGPVRVDVPYDEVTAGYAAIEGEGDGSLEYWRMAHWAFFSRECKRIGREPQGSMLVVCSIFEVLNVLPPSREC